MILAKATCGEMNPDAKFVLFEEKTSMQIEIIKSSQDGTLSKDWTKVWVTWVQVFDFIKTQNIYLKTVK